MQTQHWSAYTCVCLHTVAGWAAHTEITWRLVIKSRWSLTCTVLCALQQHSNCPVKSGMADWDGCTLPSSQLCCTSHKMLCTQLATATQNTCSGAYSQNCVTSFKAASNNATTVCLRLWLWWKKCDPIKMFQGFQCQFFFFFFKKNQISSVVLLDFAVMSGSSEWSLQHRVLPYLHPTF